MSRAEGERLELVSLMVLLQAKSVPERLLIPAFLYFFLKLYPPQWIADRKSKMAGAAGGCVLLECAALEKIGGLEAIRGEVIDDCALARAVKRSGGGIWMGLTRKSVSLRAYTSFGEIRDLIARTAFTQLGYSSLVLAGTLLGMLLTYVAPVVFTFSAWAVVWRLSLAAWALMALTYLPTVRFYGMSALWAPIVARGGGFLFVCDMDFGGAVLDGARGTCGRGGCRRGEEERKERKKRRPAPKPGRGKQKAPASESGRYKDMGITVVGDGRHILL